MTPRNLAVNQVRRRRRPIPSVPPTPSVPDVTAPRWYCPGCGQVRPEQGVWEVEGDNSTHHTAVRRHFVYVPGPWPKGMEHRIGESMGRTECPGGPIDPIKDRAP